ncbi:hypothetical protein [Persicobacter psychrovividus]|uniref:Uncharacterized protein n=1 Tax=Persicobacter psychrovividus TaxID=387638 RepID=A0ABN6LDK4_9BACT|nr:hypothetical protein PEPS_35550 [Persicobacter psychrovividus]
MKRELIEDKLKEKLLQKIEVEQVELLSNSDFERLSQLIFERTQIMLSVTTLKRFFGKVSVSENYKTSNSTLNTLCCFVGYNSLEEFQKVHRPVKLDVKLPLFNKWSVSALFSSILIVGLYLFLPNSDQSTLEIGERKLSGSFPFTVSFDYQIKGQDQYYVKFEQYHSLEPLSDDYQRISHIYEFPGFYNILIYKKQGDVENYQVVDTLQAHIQYPDWMGETYHSGTKSDAKRVLQVDHDGELMISPSQIAKVGMDSSSLYFTSMMYSKPMPVDLDDFSFEGYLQMDTHQDEDFCKWIDLQLTGEFGRKIWLTFVPEGCDRWAKVVISEHQRDGYHHDNQAFMINDKMKWHQVNIRSKNGLVQVDVDGQQILQQKYTLPLGQLMAVNCRANRSGKFKGLKLNGQSIEKNLIVLGEVEAKKEVR